MAHYIGQSEDTQEMIQLLYAGLQTQTPVILWGPPGVGKTALIRALAEYANLPLFILLASTMDPTDINGLPAIKEVTIERNSSNTHADGTPIRETVTVTEPTLQYWSEALIREGKGILFFDEANNAVPSVQSALLSVLQGRLVGRHTLPDSVWMIAAANETKDAADGWELSPPMANRFLHVDFTPNFEDWCEGMITGWGENSEIDALDEKSKTKALRLQLERAKIVQFLKQHPTLWLNMPKTDTERGKAWSSPRSWDAAARLLSCLSVKNRSTRARALRGSVGEASAIAFEKFERGLKLPPYEIIIKAPHAMAWKTMSAAETRIVLDMVVVNMNATNIEASLKVFSAVSTIGERTDIAASMFFPLVDKLDPYLKSGQVKTAQLVPLINEYTPFLKEAKLE